MNNPYNAANLSTPHGFQMAQHMAATSPPQHSSAAVLNTFYNGHPHHHQQQQHQQLAATVTAAGGGLYADPRQLQIPSNALDKAYYTAALGSTPQRFYTTTASAAATQVGASNHHPNTILITNNFSHQQAVQPQTQPDSQRTAASLNPASNIRIVSTAGNTSNLVNTTGDYQQAQHVFNLNNNKALQQLFPQHSLQQHQQNFHQPAEVMAHQFAAQQFPLGHNVTATTSPMQMSQYYVSTPDAAQITNSTGKILAATVTTTSDTDTSNALLSDSGNSNQNPSSTVVLDRINICINNLYTDTSSSGSNSLTSTPVQQPSPIIPAIQHKPIVDTGPVPILSPNGGDIYESVLLVIDEPDSTTTATTPHTPPTTPENTPPNFSVNSNNITTTTNDISSPSTSSTTTVGTSILGGRQHDLPLSNNILSTKQNFASVAQNIEKAAVQYSEKVIQAPTAGINNLNALPSSQVQQPLASSIPLTPPTPPSPKIVNKPLVAIVDLTDSPSAHTSISTSVKNQNILPLFANGEDVLINRFDGRFYLGTVMEKSPASNQYRVRFDDKTEQWCKTEEMRKFGSGSSNNTSADGASHSQDQQAMCVSCKQQQPDSKVEVCERCGRGYHRQCTKETMPGSNDWLCKRCEKPMKLNIESDMITEDESECDAMTICQLPYDVNSLTWDSKHRVNQEETYCYCGKSGTFDHNMLQCCRCLNWYHTQCSNKFKGTMLRGDSFFVFCCSICNDGEEHLRRLQVEWVDVVHLILYNLSTMNKQQNHKYHHLLKDIYPFALEKRKILPITKESLQMPENDFLDKIHSTLKEDKGRFGRAKGFKNANCFFALHTNEPPNCPKISLNKTEKITDSFLINDLKFNLLPGAPENADVLLWPRNDNKKGEYNLTPTTTKSNINEDSSARDVYAFDDTSDDETLIKLILDKVNKIKGLSDELNTNAPATSIKTTYEAMDVEDDNANDLVLTKESAPSCESAHHVASNDADKIHSPKKETISMKSSSEATTSTDDNVPLLPKKNVTTASSSKFSGKTSRKRKGFNLTKSYEAQRLSDSSSDENSSSSSRGTSLDLIIPPPKNFLGENNPFLLVTPNKKNDMPTAGSSTAYGTKKAVSFAIFDTNGFNLSSQLSALKSAGLFPKLSTSNLAKAAGQPRTVRTIKRRLSAKDITIGPNQEVRRRRTRRLSANIEVISTTTINPIPTNFFPIHAKDLLAAAAASITSAATLFPTPTVSSSSTSSPPTVSNKLEMSGSSNALNRSAPTETVKDTKTVDNNSHGRRLRQRPPKCSPNTSRRSSVSSNQSSTSSSAIALPMQQKQQQKQPQTQNAQQSHEELKQTVNKYFGIINRIESGEQFSIRAKRQLSNGQTQYLIEWGEQQSLPSSQSNTPQKQQTQPDTTPENPSMQIQLEFNDTATAAAAAVDEKMTDNVNPNKNG